MHKMMTMVSTLAIVRAVAHDSGGWKKDANGALVLDANGDPIFVNAAGQEMSVQQSTITRLNAEARDNRVRAEKAEESLKVFEGLDASAARDAIEKLSKIDQKTLIDAGEVDKVREQVAAQYREQVNTLTGERDKLNSTIDSLHLDRDFDRSKFIAENIAVPPEMFINQFRGNFKRENGKTVAYDANGNVIYSPKRMSEPATVDEALEIIINGYAYKDQILKAPGHGGTGGQGVPSRPGTRRILRSEFEQLSPAEQATTAAAVGKGEMQIVD